MITNENFPSDNFLQHPEAAERDASIDDVMGACLAIQSEIGRTPDDKLSWVMAQTPDSLTATLVRLNSAVRSIDATEHDFDGHDVSLAAAGIVSEVPPDQEDKPTLIASLLEDAQQLIDQSTQDETDKETTLKTIAMALPTGVVAIHPFKDGNGRTTRLLRMLLHTDQPVHEHTVRRAMDGYDLLRYDTTPVDYADKTISDDLVAASGYPDYYPFADHSSSSIKDLLADHRDKLPEKMMEAQNDTTVFFETLRRFSHEIGIPDQSTFELTVNAIGNNPYSAQLLAKQYRAVRYQRTELLNKAFLGIIEAPTNKLQPSTLQTIGGIFLELQRQEKGQEPLDAKTLLTLHDLQLEASEAATPINNPPEDQLVLSAVARQVATKGASKKPAINP